MTLKYIDEYRDPEVAKGMVDRIKKVIRKEVCLMEVCGTHTTSIFRSGLRALLPDALALISGPGCPVCVTAQNEIDAFVQLSKLDGVIVATFGDLVRVPGTHSSLQKERANGSDIRVVYSALDALQIARKNAGKNVVFLGVGFETTAPTIAASIISAKEMRINNYHVFSAHKLVPPALASLMEVRGLRTDGFLIPGHVSVIIGTQPYLPLIERYHVPFAISGFEPADILQAILNLIKQIESGRARIENCYPRAVTFDGNVKAKKIMGDVFETVDVNWRGIGTIPKSGLKIREKFASFDAQKAFDFTVPDSEDPKGCSCGEILTGIRTPPDCALYKKACTPMHPVGPCMVSSEGSCAAYYRYHTN
jgi:hydrogenase expression/formation protein HypD